jgi:hypothetical protein
LFFHWKKLLLKENKAIQLSVQSYCFTSSKKCGRIYKFFILPVLGFKEITNELKEGGFLWVKREELHLVSTVKELLLF